MYVDVAHGGHCSNSATTTCSTTPFTFQQIVDSVVTGMFTNMVSNDPRPDLRAPDEHHGCTAGDDPGDGAEHVDRDR